MIIKSHIRGGYRSAAQYLKEQGQNEKTRLVEISDTDAKNLDQAFKNMWGVAGKTRCTKPLHHISINPMKGERLTDEQVFKIVERCEEKYGYKPSQHQRVIVEHIKDGRQHFHVIWNRVNMDTGKPVWPGKHWNKSKEVCREMEAELGLMRPGTRIAKTRQRAKGMPRGNAKMNLLKHNPSSQLELRPIRASISSKTFKEEPTSKPAPAIAKGSKGWPEAAVTDWETWGHRNPPRFFALWPELSI